MNLPKNSLIVLLMATSELDFKYKKGKFVIHSKIEIEDDTYMIHIHILLGKMIVGYILEYVLSFLLL